MDKIVYYQKIIREIFLSRVNDKYANMKDIENQVIFDTENNRFQLISIGFDKNTRIHDCVYHLDIINEKIWIQEDNSGFSIAEQLMDAGIDKSEIVLAFHAPYKRPYTGFAIA